MFDLDCAAPGEPVEIPVTKGIVAAGGRGTRLLPSTKAIPKAMHPVGGKPLIHHAVAELVNSGIERIAILCRGGDHTIRDYFRANSSLLTILEARGREDLVSLIRGTEIQANLCFLDSRDPDDLGGAILEATQFIDGEPFALSLADEIGEPGTLAYRWLFSAFREYRVCVSAMLTKAGKSQPRRVERINPQQRSGWESHTAHAGTQLLGRYLCTPELLGAIERIHFSQSGPVDLMDALEVLARAGRLLAIPYPGHWWHCGDPLGYWKAVVAYASVDEVHGAAFRKFLCQKIGEF